MIPTFISELVRAVVIMTVTGGLLCLLLLAIKPATRHRLPKSAQYYFWLVALAAFLIPVSRIVALPGAMADIAPIHNVVERNVISTAEARDRGAVIDMPLAPGANIANAPALPAATVCTHADNYNVPPPAEPAFITQAITVFMMAYPLIFALVLLYNLAGYACFKRKLRRNCFKPHAFELDMLKKLTRGRRTPRLIVSDYAATPMLIGLFRPMIVLPHREYTGQQMHSILLHELTHMRRCDVAVKWLTLLACAAHWFNPLVWVAKREIDRVCELSCDETVIRNMDAYGKQHYGETLISVASNKKIPMPVLSTTMCEEKRALKERLTAIMKNKKHTKLAVLVSALIFVAVILAACATGAGNGNNDGTGDVNQYTNDNDINNDNIINGEYPDNEETNDPEEQDITGEPSEPDDQQTTDNQTATAARPEYITILGEQYSTSLTLLSISGPITDEEFAQLRYMTDLRYLWIGAEDPSHQITCLSPLAGLTNLVEIFLNADYVTDITPFAGLINLRNIHLFRSQISDISPLANLTNLEILQFAASQVTDITPLAGLTNLIVLDLSWNQISDISPVAGLTNLWQLVLIDNQITDITPIASLVNNGRSYLSHLRLSGNLITDVTPLAVFPHIDSLWLDGNPITDLSPLDHIYNIVFEMMEP